MRARAGALIALAMFLAGAAPAGAADLAITIDAGLRTMSNSPDTEKAIFDTARGFGGGLGLTYDRGSRLRFGIEARRVSRDGERAFAADRNSEAFRLGHPLTFTMTEGLATVAYRFGRFGPVTPYLGVSGGLVAWRERSDIAGLVERASGTAGLVEGRFGLERQSGRVRYGLEGGITLIPSAVGVGGISQVYEESDLGGLFVVLRLSFSRN